MSYPTISTNQHIQFRYESMRRKGESHNMAEMLALRSPPRSMTDDVYLDGLIRPEQLYGELHANQLRDAAKKSGYNPTPTDVYDPQLADYFGDPKGFINHGHARGHYRKVCEEKGVSSEGAVSVKARSPISDPHEGPVLSEKVVNGLVKEYDQQNPDEARKMSKEDKKANVIAKHGRKK